MAVRISDEREAAALGAPAGTVPAGVSRQLSTLDRYLPVWIGVAIVALPVAQGWQWVTVVSPVFVVLLL
ncbi:MAG: hypothetical protein J0H06_15470, partial [Actinobacteria bacterium]|nr:hypothetical protein [Actinomycetota bacterium]